MRSELRPPATDADWAAYHAIRLVFWHESEIVGVMRVDVDGITAMVRRVAVRDDVQRRGHGRRMLASAEEFAFELGCARMASHVDPSAVGFYERCGFLCDDAATTGTGAVLMTKQLTGD